MQHPDFVLIDLLDGAVARSRAAAATLSRSCRSYIASLPAWQVCVSAPAALQFPQPLLQGNDLLLQIGKLLLQGDYDGLLLEQCFSLLGDERQQAFPHYPGEIGQ